MKQRRFLAVLLAVVLATPLSAREKVSDPPSEVGHLGYVSGSVQLQPMGMDFRPAAKNYPITAGDHLWVDPGSGADVEIGGSVIHLAGSTALGIMTLDERKVQLSLTEGTMSIRARLIESGQALEVDTPNGMITLLRNGEYRMDVDLENKVTAVIVREGAADVSDGVGTFRLADRQMNRFRGEDLIIADGEPRSAPTPDTFEKSCQERDGVTEIAVKGLPSNVPYEVGLPELTKVKPFEVDESYGPVWYAPADYEPYRDGHWAYVNPWGWTWVDNAAWGFTTSHYGRWTMINSRWAWVPGQRRQTYAPALVAFVGGSEGSAAWVALGPGEAYRPWFKTSKTYVTNINLGASRNGHVVVVKKMGYANRGYVTSVSRDVFTGSRPVRPAAVRVSAVALQHSRSREMKLQPTHESYLGHGPGMRMAARPPARVTQTAVLTRNSPPKGSGIAVRMANVPSSRTSPTGRDNRKHADSGISSSGRKADNQSAGASEIKKTPKPDKKERAANPNRQDGNAGRTAAKPSRESSPGSRTVQSEKRNAEVRTPKTTRPSAQPGRASTRVSENRTGSSPASSTPRQVPVRTQQQQAPASAPRQVPARAERQQAPARTQQQAPARTERQQAPPRVQQQAPPRPQPQPQQAPARTQQQQAPARTQQQAPAKSAPPPEKKK